jgi:ATP-dependent exoDNAse (exonuclease V) beta subunit
VTRQARAGDIAILFRSRASHREFERALERRGIPTYVYKGLGFFDADEIKDVTALLRYLADPASDLRAAALLRSRFVRLSDRGLAALAPRLAAALADAAAPPAAGALDDEDRRVLDHLRAHVGQWTAAVDRVPPADLVEDVLASTAYAYELRGGRRLQAWENLKKMRGLIRRVQNRGYATLTRLADHIDALTAGDESNAAIEALEAVNLMTVHASKGLEFPIVFVVNLAKGASGPPQPVRVIVDGRGGEPSVSVGPFVSETDELERERERHETKRLLYVALTRARDRLYLSSVVKDGVLVPGRGSLAEVLPESFRPLFAHAATAFEACPAVAWTGLSGQTFEWRLCRPPSADTGTGLVAVETAADAPLDDFTMVSTAGDVSRVPVTEWLSGHEVPGPARGGPSADAVAGTLVHRLFQHGARLARLEEAEIEACARVLLASDPAAIDGNPGAIVRRAIDAWRRISRQPDVAELLAQGRCLFEVPFSLETGGTILRGAIDCLVLHESGAATVLEFKTGAPRPWHEQQLTLYLEAVRVLFPATQVDGRLVYDEAAAE